MAAQPAHDPDEFDDVPEDEADDLPWFAACDLVAAEHPALEVRGRIDWSLPRGRATAILSFPGDSGDRLPALIFCDPDAPRAEMIRRLRLGASRLMARLERADPGPVLLPFRPRN